MKELLTEEEKLNVKEILDCIKKFENGDDSYYNDIITIIKGIKHFNIHAKSIYLKFSFIVYCTKIKSNMLDAMFSKEEINEKTALFQACYEDLENYNNANKKLTKYLALGHKTGNYPDLEAAYLLTIYLSNYLYNIQDYLKEIKLSDKYTTEFLTYVPNQKVLKNCLTRKKTPTKLCSALDNNETI